MYTKTGLFHKHGWAGERNRDYQITPQQNGSGLKSSIVTQHGTLKRLAYETGQQHQIQWLLYLHPPIMGCSIWGYVMTKMREIAGKR